MSHKSTHFPYKHPLRTDKRHVVPCPRKTTKQIIKLVHNGKLRKLSVMTTEAASIISTKFPMEGF